jgi:ribulose-phosphate 3-epimerase
MIKLSPSILAADFLNLGEGLRSVEAAGADYIHFDVMDGHFVPNITFGFPLLKAVSRSIHVPTDVHLMIRGADAYLEEFAANGANLLTIHAEAVPDVSATVRRIHELGMKAGVAIKPATPIDGVLPLLPEIDMVLVMTVEPGFGGQSFIESTIPKIRELRRIINERGYDCDIQVDGGITVENIAEVAGYGANVIVAGSAVFGEKDAGAALARLRRAIEN